MFNYLKMSFKFMNTFAFDYIKYMIKYILIGLFGLIIVWFSQYNAVFALFVIFVSIPAVCYAFWKGYVATYALNYSALDFLENKPIAPFENYIKLAFKNEAELAKFVGFVAIITLLGIIPSLFYIINAINIENLLTNPTGEFMKPEFFKVLTINCVILAPLINFSLQSFFFRQKENYFILIINCYKTGIAGFVVSLIFIGITSMLEFYALTFLFLNLFIYSFNLFLYYSKTKKSLSAR